MRDKCFRCNIEHPKDPMLRNAEFTANGECVHQVPCLERQLAQATERAERAEATLGEVRDQLQAVQVILRETGPLAIVPQIDMALDILSPHAAEPPLAVVEGCPVCVDGVGDQEFYEVDGKSVAKIDCPHCDGTGFQNQAVTIRRREGEHGG